MQITIPPSLYLSTYIYTKFMVASPLGPHKCQTQPHEMGNPDYGLTRGGIVIIMIVSLIQLTSLNFVFTVREPRRIVTPTLLFGDYDF